MKRAALRRHCTATSILHPSEETCPLNIQIISIRIFVTVILVMTVTCRPISAESLNLTLPQAVGLALQHNGELKSFRQEQEAYEAAMIRAGLPPNPFIDLEGSTGALTGSRNESSLSVGMYQEFIIGSKINKRSAVAKHELDIYRWQLADRERLLRVEVMIAFYDALLSKERLALSERSITINRQLLEVAKERLNAGDIPELEANIVKVELARSESCRIETAKTLLHSQARLQTLMGLPSNRPTLEGTLDSGSYSGMTLADLQSTAQANRPDISALKAMHERNITAVNLNQAERIPNLTAGLAFRRTTTSMTIGGIEGNETAYTIGIRLSMPIPVFDRNQAGIQEAKARQNSSDTRLISAVTTVEQEVEITYNSFQYATSVLDLYKTGIIPQLEENLKLVQEAYRLGEVGILAVIQEQKKFYEVSDGYLAARHARQIALAKLESATASELRRGEK